MTELEIIGTNIKRCRSAKGWTQADLGKRVRMTKDSISRVELGKQNIGMQQLIRIQRELGIGPVDLYLEDPEAIYLKLSFSREDMSTLDKITARIERLGLFKGVSKEQG